MISITPIRPDQTIEARRVIYTVAHEMFHDGRTLEESIAIYEQTWPIPDVANYWNSYMNNGGTFLVICDGERIIGTGALRKLENSVGEIKRLWLLPRYHGQGLGYRVMMEILDVAREIGYTRVRLETSPKDQPRAFAFYQRLGFIEIPRYGDDPDDVGMELVLSGD